MATDKVTGCVQNAKGPIAPKLNLNPKDATANAVESKGAAMGPMVGHPAPDFEASAYHEGGFKNVSLSDFAGKWVFLCFYPGDFTFV